MRKIEERTPLASTKYSVLSSRSNTKNKYSADSSSSAIGQRSQSPLSPRFTAMSTRSASKLMRRAATRRSAPRARAASPGVTWMLYGFSARASPQGKSRNGALCRTNGGANRSTSSANSVAPARNVDDRARALCSTRRPWLISAHLASADSTMCRVKAAERSACPCALGSELNSTALTMCASSERSCSSR